MIGRANRFHGQAAVRRTLSKGHSVRSGVLSLKYADNPKRQTYRLAVVVSRKVSKSAVVRNRIRRRVYENVRILSSELIRSSDLIISVYDIRLLELSPSELNHELTKLCKKAGLLPSGAASHAIVLTKES